MQTKTYTMVVLAILLLIGSASATYDSSVTLENKNSTWAVIDNDGISATVDFNATGDEFEWHVYGCVGLNPEPCYYLIYYGDERTDRFANYGGGYPGAVITSFDTNGCGDFDKEGTTELGMNLPSYPDGNMDVYNYSESPDFYEPGCGAKLWVVPCEGYDSEAHSFYPNWDHDNYLFETSLIWYDDTDANETPTVKASTDDEYDAGDTVNFTAVVCDYDGVGDLEDMVVTVNLTEYGIEDLIPLTLNETYNCTCAEYIGSTVVTNASEDKICGVVTATDPSGESNESKVCFYVHPGPCAYLEFVGIEPFGRYDPYSPPEPKDEALTQLWWCIHPGSDPNANWFLDYFYNYKLYVVSMQVYSYDEYDNLIGPAAYSCCEEITMTVDSPATLAYMDGFVLVYNEETAADVTVRAHCNSGSVDSAEHTISFLQPISQLEVTADVDALYAPDECNDVDIFNITAQILDAFGNDILMPDVPVTLYIDREGQGTVSGDSYTDSNGTAIFDITLETTESGTVVSFRAEAECREGSMTIDVIDPVLYCVEIDAPEQMTSGEEECPTYACYTDHDTLMCCPTCPPAEWTATLGEIDEDGCFTAGENEGVAEIEVNVSGVTNTTEIVINAEGNCTEVTANEEFVVTSGTVSITGNWTDDGEACVQAFGDPIPEWTNDTKGVEVMVDENVTLDLNGTGDVWMYNGTTGNWSLYATGDTAEIGSGTYALVTEGEAEPDPEPDPDPEPTPTAKSGSSGGSGSGGTYPPGWPNGDSDNATVPDDKVGIPTPVETEPKSPTQPDTSGDKAGVSGDEAEPTPTDTPSTPGFIAAVAIVGIIAVAFLIGRKKE